jgi:hypothetical protein
MEEQGRPMIRSELPPLSTRVVRVEDKPLLVDTLHEHHAHRGCAVCVRCCECHRLWHGSRCRGGVEPAPELTQRVRVEVGATQRPLVLSHLRDDGLPERDRDGLRARIRFELRHRLAHVRADGLRRDVQPFADLIVRVPVGEQAQNLALPLRE